MWLDNSAQLWSTGVNVGSQVKNKKGERMSFFYGLWRVSTDCCDSVGFTSYLRERQDFGCCGRHNWLWYQNMTGWMFLTDGRIIWMFIYLGPLQVWGQRSLGIQSEMCTCCFVAQHKKNLRTFSTPPTGHIQNSPSFLFRPWSRRATQADDKLRKMRPQTV